MLPQILLGKTDASLRMRKLWRFLPNLCSHSLLHKPCANLLFLLGGFNEKNLNMVRPSICLALKGRLSARSGGPQVFTTDLCMVTGLGWVSFRTWALRQPLVGTFSHRNIWCPSLGIGDLWFQGRMAAHGSGKPNAADLADVIY